MERFFGFDLGDAESAVSTLKKDENRPPEVLTVRGAKSFITAFARLEDRKLLIGENACYDPDAVERKLRFKSRFLTDPEAAGDIKSFAAGVLGELYASGDLVAGEDAGFYIGCPAGWDKHTRERYRAIFERVGYPPACIISESRAALVSACQSRHLQVGYDILSHPVLVVDIGSSTTDFAYISGGREVELRTAGEVALGGGIMDEILLEENIARSPDADRIRRVFEKSEPWRSYAEFACRRLKEKYFSDVDYWKDNDCTETLRIQYDKPIRLTLTMNREIADRLLNGRTARLNYRSFRDVFCESLRATRAGIQGDMPDLLFLTGGVSRLEELSAWCREVYPEAVIITGIEPEFSVSRGLAWCGRIDEDLREFRREIADLTDSTTVERIVSEHLDGLYRSAVDTLTEPILKEAVLPVIEKWRSGGIKRLCDIDAALENEITAYLHADASRTLLVKPVAAWLKPVAYALEAYTVPICVKHHVPYKALSLTSYLSLSEIDIRVDAKNVFAVNEITWLIDTIISIVVGLLCGGSGIAIVTSGLPGIIAGAVISLLVLLLGKDQMQEVLLKANLPLPMRRLLPRKYFESRIERISAEVKQNFLESLEKEKNEEISARLVKDISSQIEDCLMKMAEVVEIPLG